MDDIEYFLGKRGVKARTFYIKKLKFSTATYYNRRQNPDAMTLYEYKTLVREGAIPDDVVLEHIKGKTKAP
jgi:hypothetical protein